MKSPSALPNSLYHQIPHLIEIVQQVIGDDVVGAYLFGSAVMGGLRPRSDLDVMVVSARATTRAEKKDLGARLLQLSGKPRSLELTIVVASDIRPWRYPPRMDSLFGDWWREEFERGELEPWGSYTNPDLASLIKMVLVADCSLLGPPPAEVFDPVPRRDYVASLVHGIDQLLAKVGSDTTNVVLTLARTWRGVSIDEIVSKDVAADWALARLPEEHRPIVARARAIYLGEQDDWSENPVPKAQSYANFVAAQVRALHNP
jgi:predicted nucleotidyltransferase